MIAVNCDIWHAFSIQCSYATRHGLTITLVSYYTIIRVLTIAWIWLPNLVGKFSEMFNTRIPCLSTEKTKSALSSRTNSPLTLIAVGSLLLWQKRHLIGRQCKRELEMPKCIFDACQICFRLEFSTYANEWSNMALFALTWGVPKNITASEWSYSWWYSFFFEILVFWMLSLIIQPPMPWPTYVVRFLVRIFEINLNLNLDPYPN